MAFYRYTVIDQSSGLDEISGLIESDDQHMAILNLMQKGYMVREIRIATQDDIQIERLKRFRKNLTVDPKIKGMSLAPLGVTKRYFISLSSVFVIFTILLVIAYIILEM